jgi:hypothetical protein
MAAAEGPDKGRGVRPAAQRQRGHLQAHDPPLGPLLQLGDVCCGELQSHGLVEKAGGLLRGKAQVVGAEFHQLTT